MRALATAIALLLLTVALAASPEIEAAVKVFQTLGSDPNRLKTFCELIEVEEENRQNADPFVESKMNKMLEELGADFKSAWKTVEDTDPASDDGQVLYAALDRFSDKCFD